MRRAVCGLALVLLLSAPAVAFGDNVFTLSGTLADGGTFNGILTLGTGTDPDNITGTIVDGSGNSFYVPGFGDGEAFDDGTVIDVDAFPAFAPLYDVAAIIPVSQLSTGGALCSLDNSCGPLAISFVSDPYVNDDQFVSLTATPLSATPEPGTLALFGTGLLGMVGAVRRRVVR